MAIGALAEGFAKGYIAREGINNQRAQRGLMEQREKRLQDQNVREGEEHALNMRAKGLQLEGLEREAAASKTIEEAMKKAASPRMEAVPVQGSAIGGDLGSGEAGQSGAEQPVGAQVQYREADDRSPEERMLDGMDAGWMAAMQQGRMDLAGKHFNAASQARTVLRTKALDAADQQFEATGDYGVYKDVYNKFVGDGRKILEMQKGEGGAMEITFQGADGKQQTKAIPGDQVGQFVGMLRDPKAMRALEAKRAEEVFKNNMRMKAEDRKQDRLDSRASIMQEGLMKRAEMTQAGQDRRQKASEAAADRRQKFGEAAAERRTLITQKGLVERARARGGNGGETEEVYGGAKGAAKWVNDFETKFLPKTAKTGPDGEPVMDAEGKSVEAVDQKLAGAMRQIADRNKEVLIKGNIHPQRAADALEPIARAFASEPKKGATPAQRRQAIMQQLEGRVAFVAPEGSDKPTKAVAKVGDTFVELPENMERELLAAEAERGKAKGDRYDERERGFVQRGRPAQSRPVPERKRPEERPVGPQGGLSVGERYQAAGRELKDKVGGIGRAVRGLFGDDEEE